MFLHKWQSKPHLNRSSDFWFDLEMDWLRPHLRPRSPVPVPPAPAAEGSRTSTSDVLASVIEWVDVVEKIVDVLPMPGLKQKISPIRTVLQSVEVKVIHYLRLGWRLLMAIWFFLRNQTITKGR